MDLATIRDTAVALRGQIQRVVVGHDHAIDLLLTSLLAEGHILFEGVPGVAKTLLARAFAAGLHLGFGRVQFTPDLMPGDVIGTNLFNFQTGRFTLTKGPIFTDLLLADEINRTPPKTQAALLQAMQERLVTIDGTTHDLGPGFMVIATQNPIEQEGTYPLPEAQLDRFLFKVVIGYPSRDEERAIVARHGHVTAMPKVEQFGIEAVADLDRLVAMRAVVRQVRMSDAILDYVVDLVRTTRERTSLAFGASPRAATMLASAARAYAALAGRDFVLPDDVKVLAVPALRHRVVLSPGAEIEGLSAEGVVRQILEQVPAPR
ncbi:MAG: MoxR family ATPase [Kofleriaceae bacterium]|nr:MoxR family ATPase [Kofleriaceae bacterium]MCL4223931.1 MoxR family ATPase [Myxococcales bacterium]